MPRGWWRLRCRWLLRALDPLEDRLVFARSFRPPLPSAVSRGACIRDTFAFRGGGGLTQEQAVFGIAAVYDVLYGIPRGVEQGVVGVAVDAGVPVGALSPQDRLHVRSEEG